MYLLLLLLHHQSSKKRHHKKNDMTLSFYSQLYIVSQASCFKEYYYIGFNEGKRGNG